MGVMGCSIGPLVVHDKCNLAFSSMLTQRPFLSMGDASDLCADWLEYGLLFDRDASDICTNLIVSISKCCEVPDRRQKIVAVVARHQTELYPFTECEPGGSAERFGEPNRPILASARTPKSTPLDLYLR